MTEMAMLKVNSTSSRKAGSGSTIMARMMMINTGAPSWARLKRARKPWVE